MLSGRGWDRCSSFSSCAVIMGALSGFEFAKLQNTNPSVELKLVLVSVMGPLQSIGLEFVC